MKIVCPECQSQFPLSAGLLDAEAKRFGVALAAVEPQLGRALITYLSLHKPAKTVLRLTKAARIVEEITDLVAVGSVSRNGVTRPATPAMWASAIEQMIDTRAKLRLPLSGHGYLLEVVAGLADQAGAIAERTREAAAKTGRRPVGPSPPTVAADPLADQLAYLDKMHEYGRLNDAEWDAEREKAFKKYGAKAGQA